MSGDIWAVTPSTSATVIKAAASIAGAGALTLLVNDLGPNGSGYKVLITSVGNDSGITFTIVGKKVGDLTGGFTIEVVTGPNATTASSTNFYTYVQSITASGASAGNVSLGTTGSLALPRTRIKGVVYTGATNAGSIKFNLNTTSGALLLQVNTPAGSTASMFDVMVPENGILTARSAATDFAIVTLAEVTAVTVLCG